jgi:hypothetical protein
LATLSREVGGVGSPSLVSPLARSPERLGVFVISGVAAISARPLLTPCMSGKSLLGKPVTLHDSWNRSKRTGYKVVRLLMKDGKPTGVYEDFLVGFVRDDQSVWGRPVGVAVTHDGSLLVSDDGSGSIWRVSYQAK